MGTTTKLEKTYDLTFVDTLGVILTYAISLFVLLPIFSILFIYHTLVSIVARVTRPDLIRANPLESIFIPSVANPVDPAQEILNIGLHMEVEGRVGLAEVRERFAEVFLTSGKVKRDDPYLNFHCSVVTMGGYLFKKVLKRWDLEGQIKELMPKESGLDENDFISQWISTPYCKGGPAWEIGLYYKDEEEEVMDGQGRSGKVNTILLLKLHHAIGDGYSLLHILDRLTGSKTPYLVKDFGDSLWDEVKWVLLSPAKLYLYLKHIAGDMILFRYPKKINSKDLQSTFGHCMAMLRIPLEDFKVITRAYNVRFESLLMSCLGAMGERIYFDGVNVGGIGEKKKVWSTQKYVSASTGIAWPGHPIRGTGTLTNHVSLAPKIKIPLRPKDPIERLLYVERDFQSFRAHDIHKSVKRILLPIGKFVPSALFFPPINTQLVISTMLGGVEYKMLGHPLRVSGIAGIITPGTRIYAFLVSGTKELTINFMGRNDIFRNSKNLERCVKQYFMPEINDLLHSLKNGNYNTTKL